MHIKYIMHYNNRIYITYKYITCVYVEMLKKCTDKDTNFICKLGNTFLKT